jgi:hypothetical protein
MIERFKGLSPAGWYRLIVIAITAVVLLMLATVGLPGAPADEHTTGVVLIIAIVAFSAWAIGDPPLLLVASSVAAIALAFSAPSVLPTVILITGMLILFGLPALIGIRIGLGKGNTDG